MSPAMAAEQQTMPATPRTPSTPESPVTPMSTIRTAAMSRVLSVRPLIGFVRAPEKTDEITGHGGEEKPEHDHDDREEQRPPQTSTEEPVQKEQRHRERRDRHTGLPEVEVDVQPFDLNGATLGGLQIADRPTDPSDERRPKLEQGIEGRDDHRADGERPDLLLPDLGAEIDQGRLVRRLRGQVGVEKEAQRDEQQPPHDRAGKQRAGDLGTDDEADTHQGG